MVRLTCARTAWSYNWGSHSRLHTTALHRCLINRHQETESASSWPECQLMSHHRSVSAFFFVFLFIHLYRNTDALPAGLFTKVCACVSCVLPERVWGLIQLSPHAPTQAHKGPAMRIWERENWRGSCFFANVRLTLEVKKKKQKKKNTRAAIQHGALRSLKSYCAYVKLNMHVHACC